MIELAAVKESQKSFLRQLIELYSCDFSEFDQHDLNEHGSYEYRFRPRSCRDRR